MSCNFQNRATKRTSDESDTTPSEMKRLKLVRELELPRDLPKSANDRLKRLRSSLSNPCVDPFPIGWKPPAISANPADQGNKPQIVVKRPCLTAIKKKDSLPESQLHYYRKDSYKLIPDSCSMKSRLNQFQQSSVADRLKLNKSTRPYSLEMNRNRNMLSSISADSSTFLQMDNYLRPKNSTTYPGKLVWLRGTNDVQSAFQKKHFKVSNRNDSNLSEYGQKRSESYRLRYPKTCDTTFSSDAVGSTGIFGHSCTNTPKTRLEASKLSKPTIVEDTLNHPKTHLVKSLNFSENAEGKSLFKNTVTKHTTHGSIFSKVNVNQNLNNNIPPMQNMEKTGTLPSFSKTNRSMSYELNSDVNFSSSDFPYPQSVESPNIITSYSSKQSNGSVSPPRRRISIRDRLKKFAPSPNNVNTMDVAASKFIINSQPENIFNNTNSNAGMEPEPMEWNDIDITEVIQNVEQMRKVQKFPPETQTELQHMLNANNTFAEMYQNPTEDINKRDYYIVVDTNIFLSKLGIIKEILSINLKENKKLYVYIPWMVIQELDYFKDSSTSANKLQANARKAIMLLNECLGVQGSHVKAQLVMDALAAKCISKEPDDIILACCLQAKERNHIVILLSNDTNLRNKAIINKFPAYSSSDIMGKLKHNTDKSMLQIDDQQIELRTSILLSVVIDEALRTAYGDVIDQMILKKPPYTLFCAVELMRKYWIAVFSRLMQKQSLNTIDKLYDILKQKKYTGLPEYEDKKKFVDLTLTLCMFLKTAFHQHADNINILVKYVQSSI